jgi:hypothetical protein
MRKKSVRGIGPLAVLLTFLAMCASRAESWQEVILASAVLGWLILGPLWGAVAYFAFKQRSKTAIAVTVAVYLVSASVVSLWNAAVFKARLAAGDARCFNNLKQIGLALQQYEGRYGCLPPAYIADAQGKPMHSWRVLLLPFLDQDALYQQYSFKEPWDGPNNRKLHDSGIAVYRCVDDSPEYANTSYVAVVGAGTAWPGATCTRTNDIRGDPSKMILLVEVADSGLNWMEPRDIAFERMDVHVNGQPRNSISSRHRGNASVLFVDSSVGRLGDDLTPEAIRAMLRITGSRGSPLKAPP